MDMVSPLVSTSTVIASAGLAAGAVAGIAYAARAARRPAVLWIGGGAVAGWFALAFVLVRQGAFATTPDTTFPAIAPAIAVPTIIGCALLASATVRSVIARVPLQWLVGVQLYRVVGAVFLVAYLQDDVPGAFALPAGTGDVLVGITAPLVALVLARRGSDRAWPLVTAWCALGIADLVVAVTCGFLSAPSAFQQLALSDPNAAITRYPLALIPTFAVPLSIVLHVYVLARLRPQRQGAAQPRIA
jgi:hypothetical protein